MNLDMEVLDAIEAPISVWEGIAWVAGALVVGIIVGAVIAT
jgi:hypothetical protein